DDAQAEFAQRILVRLVPAAHARLVARDGDLVGQQRMVEIKRGIDDLLRGLRRIRIEAVDALPAAALVRLGDELDAVGVLKDQRLGHAARYAGGGAGEGLRAAGEIADERDQ